MTSTTPSRPLSSPDAASVTSAPIGFVSQATRGTASADEARIQSTIDRALVVRLLRDSPVAELAHAVLGTLAAVFLYFWSPIQPIALVAWALAINGAALARMLWRRRGLAGEIDPARVRREGMVRVVVLNLAWGIGAALMEPRLPFPDVALILIMLSGLIAGGLVTLMADRASFLALLVCTLGPITVVMFMRPTDHEHLAAGVLMVVFAAFTSLLHGRSHRNLVEHERTKILLGEREQEAQRQHAYLTALLVSAPNAIVVVNGEAQVTAANSRFETLFGYSAKEAVGCNLMTLIVPDAGLAEALEMRERVRRGEAPVMDGVRRHKDGRLIQVRVAAARLEGTPEEEICLLYDDITEQKQAEDVMRKARDQAERASTARAAFLANMSHEIRTPMNAVLGFVELILDTELSTEQRRALELVRSSAEALLAVINDILDFSKIEAEHMELESIPFDLHKVVHSTVSLLAVRAREKHLELVTDIAPDVPALVRGDPTRIRQVLTNLIGNAIKFTEEGEIVVSARESGPVNGNTRVRFAVRDTGIGIPAEQLANVFQEFTQADASMTRRYGGTGLGLAISKRLVDLLGGKLTVVSEVERGSEFAFTIPLLLNTSPPASAVRGPVVLARQRVLIVDDNETNRRILRDILSAEGVVLGEAASAEAGLKALRQARTRGAAFDLAIIDAQMPDRDGFALAASVHADPELAGLRIMMLTSAGQRGDAQRCRDLGIQGYLTKPIARADLLEAVAVLLSGPVTPEGQGLADVVTRHSIAESRRKLRILLVEDNPVNQEVAATMLRKRGHDVKVADNGLEAVAAARRNRYDVVLMDIQMPELDGFAATQAIRELPDGAGRDLPIIALTAHALSGERDRCLAAGMNGYLAKPFKGHELFAVVEGLVNPARPVPAPAPKGLAPVDIDEFRRTMREAGAEEAVDGILETFVRTAPERVAAVETAMTAGDGAAIMSAAHAYKSGAATIGARGLAGVLQTIEAAGRDGDVEEARRQLHDFQSASDAVIAAIEAALA